MDTFKIRFNDLKSGLLVIDTNGILGTISSIEDKHNVHVDYDNGGTGIYCMDTECSYYDPLYYRTEI